MSKLYVGTRKGLFVLARTAGGWEVVRSEFIGVPVSMLLPDPRTGSLFAAVRHGHYGPKIHFSPDDGESWQQRASPKFPEKTADLDDKNTWSLDTIWSLEAGGDDQPGRLWCGTIPGGLFCSDDAGESWRLNESLWQQPSRKSWFGGGFDEPGIHSIAVDPRNSKALTVGVSIGGVWHSDDDGATWQARTEGMWAEYMPPQTKHAAASQDPHRIVACTAHPDTLWCQHHNGIFRSEDRGRTWKELFPKNNSNFGFAVVAHPTDPKTAWFVPADDDNNRVPRDGKVIATRTRDGGETFEVLENGLPGRHAYDLTFRHALALDGTDTLAFGTTTGALFLSENGGEQFQLLNGHLPPIYCVRFG